VIYLWATLLVLVNLVWLALVLVLLPGNWLMVATTSLVAWWQWDQQMIGVPVLVAIAVLAVVGEVVEFFSGMAGSKRAGGSRWAAVGALAGAIVGAVVGTVVIPIPVIGSLLGVCGGAALGAFGVELLRGRERSVAMRIGAGAGVGQLLGTTSKFLFGMVIWVIVATAAYWP